MAKISILALLFIVALLLAVIWQVAKEFRTVMDQLDDDHIDT